MGKTSISRKESSTSNTSLRSNKSKTKNKLKMKPSRSENKKIRRRNSKKIDKLFDNICNCSAILDISDTADSDHNVTVIPIGTSTEIKTCVTDCIVKDPKPDTIVINDDSMLNDECCIVTPNKNSQHLVSSTPNRGSASRQEIRILNTNDTFVNDLNTDIKNLTKRINEDSFLTVDLTGESFNTAEGNSTLYSMDNTLDRSDCQIVGVELKNSSLSDVSGVTALNSKNQLRSFKKGIAKMNSTDKGKLLEIIMENIFNGCIPPENMTMGHTSVKVKNDCATETVEDVYIKEVIIGKVDKKNSKNSVGSNVYNPERNYEKTGLRMVVIDGSNVAMEHTKGKIFSVEGLKICIDYFLQRGHVVKAFVPRFRCKYGRSSNPRLLDQLERQGLVIYTPSREIKGRCVSSYDDRYIIQTAAEFDGVIVTGDNYRDLINENEKWRFVIESRLLPFTWVDNMIIFPKDPLGRNGPTLERFLKHTTETNINFNKFYDSL